MLHTAPNAESADGAYGTMERLRDQAAGVAGSPRAGSTIAAARRLHIASRGDLTQAVERELFVAISTLFELRGEQKKWTYAEVQAWLEMHQKIYIALDVLAAFLDKADQQLCDGRLPAALLLDIRAKVVRCNE